MALGPVYTVREYGLRDAAGNVESLGTAEEFRVWRSARNLLAMRRGDVEYVARTVTGRDTLVHGIPWKLKARYASHPGVPSNVDHATDWEPAT